MPLSNRFYPVYISEKSQCFRNETMYHTLRPLLNLSSHMIRPKRSWTFKPWLNLIEPWSNFPTNRSRGLQTWPINELAIGVDYVTFCENQENKRKGGGGLPAHEKVSLEFIISINPTFWLHDCLNRDAAPQFPLTNNCFINVSDLMFRNQHSTCTYSAPYTQTNSPVQDA